jgi:hypothetical protein
LPIISASVSRLILAASCPARTKPKTSRNTAHASRAYRQNGLAFANLA